MILTFFELETGRITRVFSSSSDSPPPVPNGEDKIEGAYPDGQYWVSNGQAIQREVIDLPDDVSVEAGANVSIATPEGTEFYVNGSLSQPPLVFDPGITLLGVNPPFPMKGKLISVVATQPDEE